MSNSKDALSTLIGRLVDNKSTPLRVSELLYPLAAANVGTAKSTSTPVTTAALGLKSGSALSTAKLKSIQFGRPSSNTTTNSSSGGSVWQGLLSQSASGGIASALTGGLSSIFGLGGLFADIGNFFGGSSKPSPPPLALFSLPDSIQQTVYSTSNRTSVYAGDSIEQAAKPGLASTIYTSSSLGRETAGSTSVPATTTDSASIAQAVKTALLTSNTLGDVIAEL